MRKISLLLVIALLVSVFATGCGGTKEEATENIIKIGVFEPLTGENGGGGQQEVDGMTYANTVKPTVTIGDVEYKIELVVSDNLSQLRIIWLTRVSSLYSVLMAQVFQSQQEKSSPVPRYLLWVPHAQILRLQIQMTGIIEFVSWILSRAQ
jgi:hypothetical protein